MPGSAAKSLQLFSPSTTSARTVRCHWTSNARTAEVVVLLQLEMPSMTTCFAQTMCVRQPGDGQLASCRPPSYCSLRCMKPMRKVTAHRPAPLQSAAYLSIDKTNQSLPGLSDLSCTSSPASGPFVAKINGSPALALPNVTGLQQGNGSSMAKSSSQRPHAHHVLFTRPQKVGCAA